MDAPDLREMVARAINRADNEWADAPRTMPHEPWPQHVADAVLSVPGIADALARDAKAAEKVAATERGMAEAETSAGRDNWRCDGYEGIAALYPEAGK